ncbi:MAG: hypothetical protein QE159_05675 [Candidatus Verstraetearchaeota archaeon]|nr:hypothetical protein [Candidatus Verstraetearchaeota archaeon]
MKINEIPKILLGTSPFIGAGQFGIKSYYYYKYFYENPKNMEKIILKSYNLGIKGIQALPYDRIIESIKNVERKINEKFKIIATINSIEDIDKFINLNTIAFILHASITDSKNLNKILKILDSIKSLGFLTGLATHKPFSILKWLLENSIDFDLIMIPFNKLGIFMDEKPEIIYELVKKLEKPIIGKKVLAAGKLNPYEALEYASKYLDIIALGIASEKEAIETFSIALKFFK